MLIDPKHLHILSAIVDAGGMSQGARNLGKSQPSLSRIVADLEARLGESLFEKGRRPLQPTELCTRLASEGRVIARATQQAQDIASQFISGHAGSVRVAGTPIFMDGVISTIIAGFQDEFPELRVDQSYGYAEELIEALRAGTVDTCVCPMEPGDVPDDIGFQRILKGRNVIACGSAHPLARKKSLRLEEISEFPWITQPAGSPLYQDLRDVLDSIGISDFKVSYSGGTLSSIINVLAGSKALTVLPFSVVYMQPKNTIVALPIRIEHPKRELGMLWNDMESHSPAKRRFIRYMTKRFAGISQAVAERQRQEIWRE
ncbi:LysR family transcriptional regulator [uncultured Roseobacter sp.]|uniref:LysR family transcriptional regulator n=1 Tax=uncultured Roseobacter sp. TaxID=114847 RepID=UPI002618220B|nr:LysR family transcriptional regulator [uncultured Roseobacter sp.]